MRGSLLRPLKIAFALTIIFFSTPAALRADSQVIFSNPQILQNTLIDISDRWDYYQNQIIQPAEFYPTIKKSNEMIVRIPHAFENGVQSATYHIRLTGLVPNERYSTNLHGAILNCGRIWCNGRIVGTAGFLSADANDAKPGDFFAPVEFQADKKGVIDIVAHVANFGSAKGGIVKKILITSKAKVREQFNLMCLVNALIFAFLAANIIYNLILASMNFKQSAYIIQIALCLLYAASVLLTGYSLTLREIIRLPFWLHRRIAVVLLCFESALSYLYSCSLQRVPFKKYAPLFFLFMATSFVALILPLEFYEKYKGVFANLGILFMTASVIMPIKLVIKRAFEHRDGVRKNLWAYNLRFAISLVMFILCVQDFALAPQTRTLIHAYPAFKLAILLFGASQCGIYAFNRDISLVRVNRHSERLSYTNGALSKVVPDQILKLLGASDITKIIPGESRIIDAIIFYAEIKHYNQLAESIGRKELYSILEEFFRTISPIILESGGFVAKHQGGGCLAIFQERNSDAIICASRIQSKMREIRQKLRKNKRTDISAGIAIHAGKVAIGTLGAGSRLDTIAVSDDVNTTLAVGRHMSKTNTQILITEEAMPYCRNYIDYVYEGHFFIYNRNQILVYSALPIKKNEQAFEDTLEAIEDEDEM